MYCSLFLDVKNDLETFMHVTCILESKSDTSFFTKLAKIRKHKKCLHFLFWAKLCFAEFVEFFMACLGSENHLCNFLTEAGYQLKSVLLIMWLYDV